LAIVRADWNINRQRQLKKYGVDVLTYIDSSKVLKSYLIRKATSNKRSAKTYKSRLMKFGYYICKLAGKKVSLDGFLDDVKEGKHNPYDLLAEYALFLQKDGDKSNEVRQKVKIAKKFLRFAHVPVNNEDFQEFVSLPKRVRPDLQAAEKAQIVDLLNNCKNQRLKLALLMSASLGSRILETCALKNSDVDFEKMTITFPGEWTKTKVERTRRMTKELAKQIKTWQMIKYRPHRQVRISGKRVYVEPVKKDEDLLLAFWDRKKQPTPDGVRDGLENEYAELARMLKIPKKNGRYVLTFHRLRSFVFTTISALGDTEFAHYFVGHSNSTYYRQTPKAIEQAYQKIEPYLTYLDVGSMEATTQDLQSKIERLEKQLVIERNKTRKFIMDEVRRQFSEMPELRGEFEAPTDTAE
jgi:integrase